MNQRHSFTSFRRKYGSLALVAGASEGIGAAFATFLATSGMDLVLVARRKEPLDKLAGQLSATFRIRTTCLYCDLAEENAASSIMLALQGKVPDVLVYNAALSRIGPFEAGSLEDHNRIAAANMITPMNMVYLMGESMLRKHKGAVILMASLAGFQGSGFLASYAATKAFNRVLAESLWYEWKSRGVDVIACCAGATSTPNYSRTNPGKTGFFAPRVESPEEVVEACLKRLGKVPSFISGRGNRIASFMMQRVLPRKTAVNIMGDTTRRLYRL